MALYDGFFDATQNEETGEYDRAYGSVDFTGYFANVIGSGVCVHNNPDSFKVRIEDNKAVVSPGYLFIKGYWLKNSADYEIDIPSTGSCAIVAHLNLGARRIELDAQSVAQTYPDALVLAIISQEAAEDTRHSKDICGVIDTAGELSQKVDWAMNYIETEIDSKLEEIEQDIAAQEEKLDKKIEDVGAVVDEIMPIPVGTIKFSANPNMGEEWLECDGRIIEKADYPELMNALLNNGGINAGFDDATFYWINADIPYGSWSSAAYGNGKFVAVTTANNGIAAYSFDGINWTQTTLPSTSYWNSVAYGIGLFVAVASDRAAAYSTDGITWISTTLPYSAFSVTYGNGMFVAVGSDAYVSYSKNGKSWMYASMPSSVSWKSVAYGNGKFVAIANNKDIAAYSTDGINWTQTTLPSTSYWNSVTYGNGLFVAIAEYSDKAAYSADGITWATTDLPYSINWKSIAYGNGLFIAVGFHDSENNMVTNKSAYSTDGINWVGIVLPTLSRWTSAIYGNGKFVALTDTSILAYSDPFNQIQLPTLSMSGIPAYIKAKSEAEEAAT